MSNGRNLRAAALAVLLVGVAVAFLAIRPTKACPEGFTPNPGGSGAEACADQITAGGGGTPEITEYKPLEESNVFWPQAAVVAGCGGIALILKRRADRSDRDATPPVPEA
jgi:hypothetical protein